MAVAEALTNLAAAPVTRRSPCVKLSANWMAAAGAPGRRRGAVRHGARRRPRPLPRPRRRASRSARTPCRCARRGASAARPRGRQPGVAHRVGVRAVRRRAGDVDAATADRRRADGPHPHRPGRRPKRRLGGSILAQVYGQTGNETPDVDDPAHVRGALRRAGGAAAGGHVLAYHDRSDGGLFVTLLRDGVRRPRGLTIDADALCDRATTSWPRRCSPRNWAPCVQVREADVARRARVSSREHGLGARASSRGRRTTARDPRGARLATWCSATRASRSTAPGAKRPGRCSRCATTRSPRSRSTTASSTPATRASRRSVTFDPDDDVAAPFIARRRAAAHRDPPRAGRERRSRDGGGLRSRRVRGARRARQRHHRGTHVACGRSAGSRRAAASRTATCSAAARAGRSRSSTTRGPGTSSPRSSRGPIRSRSACATAAR